MSATARAILQATVQTAEMHFKAACKTFSADLLIEGKDLGTGFTVFDKILKTIPMFILDPTKSCLSNIMNQTSVEFEKASFLATYLSSTTQQLQKLCTPGFIASRVLDLEDATCHAVGDLVLLTEANEATAWNFALELPSLGLVINALRQVVKEHGLLQLDQYLRMFGKDFLTILSTLPTDLTHAFWSSELTLALWTGGNVGTLKDLPSRVE